MAVSEQVIWTLCPAPANGATEALISVFVSPRLTAPGNSGTVGQAYYWSDWPAALKTMTFQLMDAGDPHSLKPLGIPLTPSSKADSGIYKALFTPHLAVENYVFKDLRGKTLLSYPVATLAKMFERLYAYTAMNAGDELPVASSLIARVPSDKGETHPVFGTLTAGWPTKPKHRPADALRVVKLSGLKKLSKSEDLQDQLDLLALYHQPLLNPKAQQHLKDPNDPKGLETASWPGFQRPALPTKDHAADDIDFHKTAAAISNFHQLARLCGLIIDFTIPLASIPKNKDLSLALKVTRHAPVVGAPTDTCPATVCHIDAAGQIHAKPFDDTRLVNGFLNLPKVAPDLVQMDVDGAGHKAMQLGGSLGRTLLATDNDDSFAEADVARAGVPSLRTAGIMLVQGDLHEDVAAKADKAYALNSDAANPMTPPILYAEDLVRGYRVDIRDRTIGMGWYSLCQRSVQHTLLDPSNGQPKLPAQPGFEKIPSGQLPASHEEGMISLAMTSTAEKAPDPAIKDVYKLHEGVFVWRGWSLSAPEPTGALRTKPGTPADKSDDAVQASMVSGPESETPPGLPLKTRFKVTPGSLPSLRFGHEYQTRLRAVDLCGFSVPLEAKGSEQLFSGKITYRRYEPLEAPAITLLKTPKGTDVPEQGESMQRLAVRTYNTDPDKPAPLSKKRSAYRTAAPARVTQRFAETHGVLDSAAGAIQPSLYATLRDIDHGFDTLSLPSVEAPADKPTDYSIINQGVTVPYLPDPYCLGLHIRMKSLDGTIQEKQVMFYENDLDAKWPVVQPVIVEGSEDFAALAVIQLGAERNYQKVIRVPMPKGCRQRVQLSAIFAPDDINKMALWQAMKDFAPAATSLDDLQKRILNGRHWMFTPWRELEFVHATQKPLVRPTLTLPAQAKRGFGDLSATVDMSSQLSAATTTRLDLNAHWNEPDDQPGGGNGQPTNRVHKEHIGQYTIDRISDAFATNNVAHNFVDTRYRRVTYSLDALSRFKEFFDKSIRDNTAAMTVTSKEVNVWVLNSAPPPPPQVLYVIPTFGWYRATGSSHLSMREGGLRVYLDRPWLVTGYNEMLAVILPDVDDTPGTPQDPDNTGDTAANSPFVTQWGRDPIWAAGQITSNSPKLVDFKLAKLHGPLSHPGTNLPAEEGTALPPAMFARNGLPVPGQDPSRTRSVAPHQVGYDKDRQLWYADITVALPKNSYYPFIRLALARYQPMSVGYQSATGAAQAVQDIKGSAFLSSAVTCDFMQLSPNRYINMYLEKGSTTDYRVLIFGAKPQKALGWYMTVQVQILDDVALDADLGWRDDGTPVTMAVPGNDNLPEIQFAKSDDYNTIVGNFFTELPDKIATFTFTPPKAPTGGKRRLLIKEYEYENYLVPLTRVIYAETMEF